MCMVTVGQSVIWAVVMILSLGSPLCECILGEGTSSLNPHWSHCCCHLRYSIPMVGCRLWLVCVFCPCVSRMVPMKWMKSLGLVCTGVSWTYGRICCHLRKCSCEMRVCGGVYHNGSSRNWSFCHMRSCDGKICEMTWSDFYEGHGSYCSYSCGYGVEIESDWI